MTFEVYRNGHRLMYTENEKCIPKEETHLSMKAAGCTFKKDGKAYKILSGKKKLSKKDGTNGKQ